MGGLFPEAPAPPVYLSAHLFENASSLRATLGDEGFFAKLNAHATRSKAVGWGSIRPTWDAGSLERAMGPSAEAAERQRLVSDLVSAFLPAQARLAASLGEGFVPLDEGLSILSRHAKELGFDGLVLFLDELILWLWNNISDLRFVENEPRRTGPSRSGACASCWTSRSRWVCPGRCRTW